MQLFTLLGLVAAMSTSVMATPIEPVAHPTSLLLPRDANGDVIDISIKPRAGAERYLNFYKDANCQQFSHQQEVWKGMYSWDACDEAPGGVKSAFAYFYDGQSVKLNWGGIRPFDFDSATFYCTPNQQTVLKTGCSRPSGGIELKGYYISS